MLMVLIRRTYPRFHANILNSYKALSSKNEWPLFFTDDLVTSYCQRLQAVVGYRCQRVTLHFSCPKTPDRLSYQSEAEQLVLERGHVVAEPEVPFFRVSGDLSSPG